MTSLTVSHSLGPTAVVRPLTFTVVRVQARVFSRTYSTPKSPQANISGRIYSSLELKKNQDKARQE